jgi:hypothetical protein
MPHIALVICSYLVAAFLGLCFGLQKGASQEGQAIIEQCELLEAFVLNGNVYQCKLQKAAPDPTKAPPNAPNS